MCPPKSYVNATKDVKDMATQSLEYLLGHIDRYLVLSSHGNKALTEDGGFT